MSSVKMLCNIVLFMVAAVIAIIIIFKYYSKFRYFSQGAYNGIGRKMFFELTRSKTEVVQLLSTISDEDIFDYTYIFDKGKYKLIIHGEKGWKRIGSIFPQIPYEVQFTNRGNREYMIIELSDASKVWLTNIYETKMFEFVVKKTASIPIKEIQRF